MQDIAQEYRFYEQLISYRETKNPLAARALSRAYIHIMDDKPISNSCRGLATMIDTLDTISSNMTHHYEEASKDISLGVTKLAVELANMLVDRISARTDSIAYYLCEADDES